jgi:hypothetical protein
MNSNRFAFLQRPLAVAKLKPAIAPVSSPTEEALKKALKDVLSHTSRYECTHEDTHRGGTIWTICDNCGCKWAVDRGGFKPYQEPKVLSDALELVRNVP